MADGDSSIDEIVLATEILDSVELPTLPEAAVRLLSMSHLAETSASELVQVIELDPALSARLLKMANGSYFGQQGRVGTLSRAAVVLGNEYVRIVALGFYLSGPWQDKTIADFDMREFWRDSVLRACLSKQLAGSSGSSSREQAFLIGLLLDIGTLIMATRYGPEYLALVADCECDIDVRREVERSRYGVDCTLLSRTLATRWNLPSEYGEALGHQWDEPSAERSADPCTALRQIAYFCAHVPFSEDRQTARISARLRALALTGFGLSFEGIGEVFTEAVGQFNIVSTVFSGLLPRERDAEMIMSQAALRLMEMGAPELPAPVASVS